MITLPNTDRHTALAYVSFYLDDALNVRKPVDMPDLSLVRLVGWQCGFEPLFVAVWSYLPGVRVSADDAVDIARDYLTERQWFVGEPTDPDFIS